MWLTLTFILLPCIANIFDVQLPLASLLGRQHGSYHRNLGVRIWFSTHGHYVRSVHQICSKPTTKFDMFFLWLNPLSETKWWSEFICSSFQTATLEKHRSPAKLQFFNVTSLLIFSRVSGIETPLISCVNGSFTAVTDWAKSSRLARTWS